MDLAGRVRFVYASANVQLGNLLQSYPGDVDLITVQARVVITSLHNAIFLLGFLPLPGHVPHQRDWSVMLDWLMTTSTRSPYRHVVRRWAVVFRRSRAMTLLQRDCTHKQLFEISRGWLPGWLLTSGYVVSCNEQ